MNQENDCVEKTSLSPLELAKKTSGRPLSCSMEKWERDKRAFGFCSRVLLPAVLVPAGTANM